ncbi:MAG TPA: acyloxyacyl hydrolase [Chthoniobacterales bacterium]
MKRHFLGCSLIFLTAGWVLAQDSVTALDPKGSLRQSISTEPSAMQGPRFTLQVMGGFYFPSGIGPGAPLGSTVDPNLHWAPIDLRVGYLLTSPSERKSLFRGVSEILLDVTVAPVTKGYADIITGPSLLLRYNFVQPNARLVPYVQGGAGLVYSDGYKAQGQDALGEAVEFLLQCQGGLRCILSDKCSLDFEFGYQHISNANFGTHNAGLNNVGGSIGFTYYLPELRHGLFGHP